MITDVQTQRDLELFRARDGGASVLGTLDRTSTPGGRKRLSKMVDVPLATAEQIRSRQDSIRFLASANVPFPVPEELIKGARKYVESNYATLCAGGRIKRLADVAWIALRYPELIRFARAGLASTRQLMERVVRFVEAVSGAGLPSELAHIFDEIRAMDGDLRDVIHGAHTRRAVLEADRTIRETFRRRMDQLMETVYELDALDSAAQLLREGYTLPEVEDEGTHLEGEGLWHPFLPEAVANPVRLRGGETLVFLTGPNMAGKTTYLKAVGLALYLGQCGLPVPAQRLRFTPVDRFITGLAPEDNLRQGISYFLAEVRRVKEVVSAVARGERTVAIFDEVFRGTNVTDALEASKAVLLGCSRAPTSMFLFSSHLSELAEALADRESVKFCYFDGDLEGSELHFDYRLRPGVSSRRFGMELLRREGLPDILESIPA